MIRLILSIVIAVLFIGSCCKGAYEIAVIKVSYPNITNTSILKAVRSHENNSTTTIVDTIYLGELNSANSYSAIIEFEENSLNYFIFVENTNYFDTISEITYNREEGCNDNIENFKCKFNGELQTDSELIIKQIGTIGFAL